MLTSIFVSNDNLIKTVLSYLNVKDLSVINCVSRSFNRVSNHFNYYWREACNEYFCSSYEQYSIFKTKDYNIPDSGKLPLDWKNNMKLGIQIKSNWAFITKNQKNMIPNFFEDCQQTCDELYNTLKQFLSLPKLRKENIHVESDLNTIHQQYMYDLLYDQQDIYDYYDELFEEKNKSISYDIKVRQPMAPFATALECFDDMLSEFFYEKDMHSLANIRWYIVNLNFENYHLENNRANSTRMMFEDSCFNINNNMNCLNYNNIPHTFNDDLFTIFSTSCTDYSSSKLIVDDYQLKNSNLLLSLLNSIVLTLTFFCRLSFSYLMKYQQNDQLFLDCYIKRYKAYVEASTYLNDNLENLNVLVNYLYETVYKDYPKNPKFSIYRLMIITWNREVITPLMDLNQEKNLVSRTLKMFKKFLILEVNKAYGSDIRLNKTKSEPSLVNCEINKVDAKNSNFSFDAQSDDEYLNNQFMTTQNAHFNNLLIYDLGNNFNHHIDSKTFILEDVYTYDFQTKYFLEQILNLQLDTICNEYSTFYVNDSQFPVSGSYQIFENNLVQILEKFINSYFQKSNKLFLIRYLKSQELINSKLINRTKIRLVETITKIIFQQCESELIMIFKEYLNSNQFNEKDAALYMKAFDLKEEKHNPLYSDFLQIAKEYLSNDHLSEYAASFFIKEVSKGRNHLYVTLEETRQWLEEVIHHQNIIDKQVRKENKRRNIQLVGDIYKGQLFNFTPNFSFIHILEIYGIDNDIELTKIINPSKAIEDVDMSIQDYSTLPQTFDLDTNFNK